MEKMNSNLYLSKSLFLRGLQCHKSLYLHKCHPELKDEISPQQEARFQSGTDVGLYAHRLFPGGVEIPYDTLTHEEQLLMTKAEIEKGTATLYEPAFSFNGVFVKVDILQEGEDGWEIYEVKAASGMKDVYFDDVAIQYYVLTDMGLPVSKAYLVYINTQYVRKGEIESERLFSRVDITELVKEKQILLEEEIKRLREMLKSGTPPDIDIGPYCSNPYDCDFHGYCWKHIPEVSVFSLREKGADKFELYRQGIIRLEDIPLDRLNGKQRQQVEAFLEKKDYINSKATKKFLDSLWYPLYFLDFETFNIPIPPFDGLRPYEKVPFQYSLYCLEHEGAEAKHYEYLALPGVDPRGELMRKLLSEVPENACVIAYNSSFETRVFRSIADWFPEYRQRIESLIKNVRDLMAPFQRRNIYCWQMQGSYSMKSVLPIMVPELSYDSMEISDGMVAAYAYSRIGASQNPEEVERIRKALLEYCGLDTLGMVKIVEKLRELCG
jgi:CRISPR/Cas system-associated exonuclease Cas4 (RecB family)